MHSPLVKKITESVNNIWLTKFILYETHNMGKVRFAHILAIDDLRHGCYDSRL